MKMKMAKMQLKAMELAQKVFYHKSRGLDGILVTVGLCIIALLLCVVMKDSLTSFIQAIVTAMQNKAIGIWDDEKEKRKRSRHIALNDHGDCCGDSDYSLFWLISDTQPK